MKSEKNGFISEHVKTIQAIYKERRDVMLRSLEKHMPNGVQWTHPAGGLFLWVTLPETMSSLSFFEAAIQEKVAFVPGNAFFPLGGGENSMRLNFSNSGPEKIEDGIARLALVIKKQFA